MSGHFYVHAADCGHGVWTRVYPSAGIRWCVPCQKYVGVIVTRKEGDRPVRVPGTPGGKEAT